MTQHDLTARAHHWATATIAGVALVSLFAYSQTKDAADNDKAQAHVERQAKSAAQPDTWDRLDRDARRMAAYDRIKK